MKFKYNEDNLLEEIKDFIAKTYDASDGKGHYVGQGGVQSLDLIFGIGHGDGFTIGNAIKYLARFGKKRGHNREDLLKAVHYVLLTIYNHDRSRGVTSIKHSPP